MSKVIYGTMPCSHRLKFPAQDCIPHITQSWLVEHSACVISSVIPRWNDPEVCLYSLHSSHTSIAFEREARPS